MFARSSLSTALAETAAVLLQSLHPFLSGVGRTLSFSFNSCTPASNTFFKSVLLMDLSKTDAQGGLLPAQLFFSKNLAESRRSRTVPLLATLVFLKRLFSHAGYKIPICRVVKVPTRSLSADRKFKSSSRPSLTLSISPRGKMSHSC